MNPNPLKQGVLTENADGIGPVTRGMVRKRAAELAVINGRPIHEVSVSDWEQAKQELTDQPGVEPKEAMLEALPDTEHWDPVPGTIGHQTPTAFDDEEDAEGQSNSAKLVEEGIKEAAHDQMLQAARQQRPEDAG